MAHIDSNLTLDEQQVERTSELINDGEKGNSKYTEIEDVIELIEKIPSTEGDKNYIHEQTTPSDIWEYQHGLNKKPSVVITDSAGTVLMGAVLINDGVTVKIQFNFPFWGYAINN